MLSRVGRTLKDLGMRFVNRGERWLWVYPELMEPEDIDCTDLPDDDLERLVWDKQKYTPKSVDSTE
jgi:hypothetical protein